MSREVRVEDVIGRKVLDPNGKSIGRVQEIVTEWQGDALVVTRYLIGVRGLLRRLSGEIWQTHGGGLGPSYAAKWDEIDLSDPRRPRLTCPVSALDRLPSADTENDL